MTNSTYKHQRTFNIAWGDMDALGHVNNVRYFDYFQEARIEWLASINFTMTANEGPVVIHTECTFFNPIIYPATVRLDSYLNNLGNTSMVMAHDIYQDEQLMAQGSSKIVWIDYIQKRSIAIPEVIRRLFD